MQTYRLIFVALVLSIPAPAQKLTTGEAAKHVGEHATVCGTIASERIASGSRGQPMFINLDKPYPNQVFTILIWGEDHPNVGNLPHDGKICATGIIKEYKGVPEIELRDSQSWMVP